MSHSETEALLKFQMLAAGIPLPDEQYRFHPVRKWAFDFAYPVDKLAIEIDGGNHMVRNGRAVGRHTQDSDYEKLDEAVIFGWRVLRFTPSQVRTLYALNTIERALGLIKDNDDSLPF